MSTEVLVALALLASPSPTPTAEVPRVMVAPPKGPIPQRMPQGAAKTVTIAVPRGDHVHRCSCGTEWSHQTGNPGHTCPHCHRVVTAIARWGPTTITRTVVDRAPATPAMRTAPAPPPLPPPLPAPDRTLTGPRLPAPVNLFPQLRSRAAAGCST
jgi:hypothetical protein